MSLPDPFQALGLPRRFDIDEAALHRAYLTRVSSIHPDLAHDDNAQAASASLNHARELLSNPESRADILVRLLGGPSKEQDKSLPHGFLMEIMETREAIEAAKRSGDVGQIRTWTTWANSERERYTREIAAQFAALSTPPAPQSLHQIRHTLNAWRYIERLIEQLDPAYNPNTADFKHH